jgi:hypothetical protein
MLPVTVDTTHQVLIPLDGLTLSANHQAHCLIEGVDLQDMEASNNMPQTQTPPPGHKVPIRCWVRLNANNQQLSGQIYLDSISQMGNSPSISLDQHAPNDTQLTMQMPNPQLCTVWLTHPPSLPHSHTQPTW